MEDRFLLCVVCALVLLGAQYGYAASVSTAYALSEEDVDTAILYSVASGWVTKGIETETAIAVASASSGGGSGKIVTVSAPVGMVDPLIMPYRQCSRVYEGGSISANGYLIKLEKVVRETMEAAPVTTNNEIGVSDVIVEYPMRIREYVKVGVYDSNRKLVHDAVIYEGGTDEWTSPSGEKLSIRACDIYYAGGYVYPKPMPLPEPMPLPVDEVPGEETDSSETYWVTDADEDVPNTAYYREVLDPSKLDTSGSSGGSGSSAGSGGAVVSTTTDTMIATAEVPDGDYYVEVEPVMPSIDVMIRPMNWASLQVSVEKQVQPCLCALVYSPVCGVDGKTYGNGCEAGCAGVEVAYKGKCKTDCPEVACYCMPGTELTYEVNENGCTVCKCVEKPQPECPENCLLNGNVCICKEPVPVCEPGCILSGSTCICPQPEKVLGTKIILHRQHRNCADDSLYEPAMGNLTEQVFEVGGDTGYWNFRCADRKQEQCYGDGSFDTYYYERCEFKPSTVSDTTIILQRETKSCDGGSTTKSESFEVGGDTGYWNFRCADRKQEQCYGDGSFDMYYVESCTFVRKDGVKPEPVPLCPPGCKRV
ncbi:MAG: Kazal-type serine protease inhibitor family protein, partial [Candidatus Micrarchaeota archaeon]